VSSSFLVLLLTKERGGMEDTRWTTTGEEFVLMVAACPVYKYFLVVN
jgi:hypothetical protein